MKKSSLISLACAVVLFCSPCTIWAQSSSNHSNLKELEAMPDIKMKGTQKIILATDDITIEQYELTEILGIDSRSYARDINLDEQITVTHKLKTILVSLQSSDYSTQLFSIDHGKTDTLGGLEYYTRLYFDEILTSKGQTFLKMVKISGGYTVQNPNWECMSQNIAVGQTGYYDGGYQNISKNLSYYSDKQWTFYPPSNWMALSRDSGTTAMGCNYSITYRRLTAAPVTIYLQNNY